MIILADFIIENYEKEVRRAKGTRYEDIMTDALHNAYLKARKEKTVCTTNPTAMMRTILFWELKRMFYKRGRAELKGAETLYKIASEQESRLPDANLINSQLVNALTLESTESASKQVIKLAIVDDMSHAEIAKKLNVTYNTAKAHIQYAKKFKEAYKRFT